MRLIFYIEIVQRTSGGLAVFLHSKRLFGHILSLIETTLQLRDFHIYWHFFATKGISMLISSPWYSTDST